MKCSLIGILVVLLFNVGLKAQDEQINHKRFRKLENLEKIKLIEALKMSEETSIRFFARQGEQKKKIREYDRQANEILHKMKKILEDKPEKCNSELKKLSEEYVKYQSLSGKERAGFINSLSDILSAEQIARLLVFEKSFREEIRNAIFKERMKDK